MPKENQSDPRKNFVPRFLPWLLGAVMLVIYWFTLNHWVTLLNLGQVAAVSGWNWQPQVFNPLTFFVTLPFRWLPAAQIPAALNIFSAVCGAATLALLARSVALLPHDRTEMERTRERSDFSFLTGWMAWFPPTLAVAFAGLQLAFWEHATSFTGESFQLLLFAIILWQLLEYRLDELDWRLFTVAVMYGAGITENWAMIAFFPVFIMVIIWLRKLDFFNPAFLIRMALCGLAGMIFLFLLPLTAKFSGTYPLTIWQALKPSLRVDWLVVKSLQIGGLRHTLALMSLTTLLPVFVMSIRWSASFGDDSRIGTTLVNYMIHVVNVVIFGVCVWVMFDPPFSPHQLLPQMGVNAPALPMYYLVALCLGYYCGYFLLVFGKNPMPSRRTSTPEPALPPSLLWLCPVIVAGTLVATALAAALLLYKNAPIIRDVNDDSLLKFAQFSTQNLPRDGAFLLCDSEDPSQNQPIRSYLLQAELAREGRENIFPVLDTQSLNLVPYHKHLHDRFPKIWPQTVTTNDVWGISPLRVYVLLNHLSKSNTLCYLNPSFGFYFEQFYQEPHGLIYMMKLLPEDTLLPPALDKNLIAENETFWTRVTETSRAAIEKALHPPDFKKPKNAAERFMLRLHVPPEPNPNALLAGTFYSRSLNYLGVQLQRANELEKAATRFSDAQKMNPDNVVAGINLAFNKTLRAGSPTAVDVTRATADQFGKYHNWNEVLCANGPFDETSFSFENGAFLMQAGLMRQAVAQFNRVRQLAPDNLAARLFLAQIYIFSRLPDRALEALHDPLQALHDPPTQPLKFGLTEFNATELNVLASAAHFQKNETTDCVALLETEITRHPDNEILLTVAAQSYFMRGLYTNAIHVINRKLARAPDDPQWLFGKGFASLQIGAYNDAVAALSRLLEIQTNSPDALFNRAIAYLQSDRLDAARADYRQLQATYTNSFQVAYGLGEIAWRKHETNEAVRNYEIYLINANTNTAEATNILQRLRDLEVPPH
jgi:tetratricopeptide (TPR) repeat protein